MLHCKSLHYILISWSFSAVLHTLTWARSTLWALPCLSVGCIFPRNLTTCMTWDHVWNTLLQKWEPRALLEQIFATLGASTIVGTYCSIGIQGSYWSNGSITAHDVVWTLLEFHLFILYWFVVDMYGFEVTLFWHIFEM